MKQLYKCKLCKFQSQRLSTLLQHVGRTHKIPSEQYYKLYGQSGKNSPICSICGAKVKYINFNVGYANTCSRKCGAKIAQINCLNKYGVKNTAMRQQTKNKVIANNLRKYGVQHTAQCSQIRAKQKATSLQRYGNQCSLRGPSIQDKTLNTLKLHYGDGIINPFQAKAVKESIEKTNIQRYGSSNIMGNQQIFNKVMSSINRSMKIKKYNYNDHIIHYQTKPQLEFIHLCQQLMYDVHDCNSIRYMFQGKKRITYPDFILTYPSGRKRIVEIKGNNWYHKQHVLSGKFAAKCNAIIQYSKWNGYLDYIVVMY